MLQIDSVNIGKVIETWFLSSYNPHLVPVIIEILLVDPTLFMNKLKIIYQQSTKENDLQ